MFPTPAEVLRASEGSLAQTPLPLLLHSLLIQERTCLLSLSTKGIQKDILIEEGSPAACRSNLLHETLGRFLVEKGKISEDQYAIAYAETMRTGTAMGDLFVAKGWVSASDLYKQIQASLARKILDCFRWPDAQYRLSEPVDLGETAVRMNTVQLILAGVAQYFPFDAVTTHLVFSDDQIFAPLPKPVHRLDELKLASRDAKLLNGFRQRPRFAQLLERSGMETEEALRKIYAFCVLGLVGFAEANAPPVASATPVVPQPPSHSPPHPPPAVMVVTAPAPEESAEFKDALAKASLDHRGKDPFALLEVPEDVTPVALRKAFLALADRFSPQRCTSADSKEKAEGLLVAYAKAYGSLADPDQLALWRKRREAARAAAMQGPKKPAGVEQFKIQTALLDARAQFAEATKRLAAGNYKGALEYFGYACDIEPKAMYRAHQAYTRFLLFPMHARLAVAELQDVLKTDGECESAHFFLGEIFRSQKEYGPAEEAYRRAFKLNGQNRRAIELAQEVAKLRR